jgi:hypothetical protein
MGWLMLWLCIIVAFGVGAIVCGILERSPWGEQDDNGWRRVPRPNARSRRSGRESW